MDIRKHQNVLAVLYFILGYTTAFLLIFTTTELYLQSFGIMMVIYYTYMISENI